MPVELEPLLKLLSRPEPRLHVAGYTQLLEIAGGAIASPKYRWIMNQAVFEVEGKTTFAGVLSHSFRPLGAVTGDTSGESKPPSWPGFLRLLREPITLSGSVTEPDLELPGFLSKDSRLRRKIDDLRKRDGEDD